MTDPRKPILRPRPESQDKMREAAYDILRCATHVGAKTMGCSGAWFVIIGINIWTAELAVQDGKAAAKMLRALADLYDPASSDAKRANADRKRQAAVDKLFHSLDLEMATPEGSA